MPPAIPPTAHIKRHLALLLVIMTTCLVSWLGWLYPRLYELLIYDTIKVTADDEGYRLITHGLLHEDTKHLFSNMLLLSISGLRLTQRLQRNSNRTFLLFYIAALLFSCFVSHLYTGTAHVCTVGASGAVCAVIAAVLLLGKEYMLARIILAYCLVYDDYKRIGLEDHIDHIAHIAGYLFGVVSALVIRKWERLK